MDDILHVDQQFSGKIIARDECVERSLSSNGRKTKHSASEIRHSCPGMWGRHAHQVVPANSSGGGNSGSSSSSGSNGDANGSANNRVVNHVRRGTGENCDPTWTMPKRL